MKTLTITKKLTDYPFAHRQPRHDGHCALIHGHNWDFEFVFTAREVDECGFVYDFGKLGWLKKWLNEQFDHTLVLNDYDKILEDEEMGWLKKHARVNVIPDCSSEGLAKYIWTHVNKILEEREGGRVRCESVTVHEDKKNSATYGSRDRG